MAVAALFAAAMTTTSTVGPATPASAAPTSLVAANFRLQETAHNDSVIAALDAALPNVTVADVLASANRTTTACTAHAPALVTSFCWQSGDNTTTDWYPQGITTTVDADPSGTYQGSSAVLVDWYYHPQTSLQKGDRVAFVDYSNPSQPVYRFVLLVEPYMNGSTPDFRPVLDGSVSLHGGGIFWYGHYLYVADTWNGFRVFDLNHLLKVSTSGSSTAIGHQSDGTYQAFNYAYVLPQSFAFTASTTGGYARLRYSSVSVDRTGSIDPGDSIVVCEYNTNTTDTHRVVRFPLDAATGKLKASSDGFVHGTQAYETGILQMQGVASVHNRFYASTSFSTSSAHYGTLYTFTPASGNTTYLNSLAPHPESLSYWGAKDELWSLSEQPDNRYVYALRAANLAPAAKFPIVQYRDTGDRVRSVQYLLNEHGATLAVDGVFGPLTKAAVEAFQSAHDLTVDGIVGPQTWHALVVTVREGSTGDAVRAVQDELTAHGIATTVSGIFDATTAANVVAFQRSWGLPATGAVDTDTWAYLVS